MEIIKPFLLPGGGTGTKDDYGIIVKDNASVNVKNLIVSGGDGFAYIEEGSEMILEENAVISTNGILTPLYVEGILSMNDGAKITGNKSVTGSGDLQKAGAVAVIGGTFNMYGGIISDNESLSSISYSQNAVYVAKAGTFHMESGEITGNKGMGAIIVKDYFDGTNKVEICGDSEIHDNNCSGIIMNSRLKSIITLSDSAKIYNNTAGGNFGGGIKAEGGTVIMKGGEIYGNTATDGGGGIALTCNDVNIYFFENKLNSNNSTFDGTGAVGAKIYNNNLTKASGQGKDVLCSVYNIDSFNENKGSVYLGTPAATYVEPTY